MIDWLLSWIELFQTEQLKLVIAVIGAIGTIVGAVTTFFERRGRRALDERLRKTEVRLADADKEIREKQHALREREATIAKREEEIDEIRTAVLKSDEQLWEMYEPRPFPDFHRRIGERRPVVITIGNLKGGVAKTTLAANLAADWAIADQKRVLIIDLDYQGSLSTMLFSAAGLTNVMSPIDEILSGKIQPGNILNVATNLSRQLPALGDTWIIPAYKSLAARENQLMVDWLMRAGADDVRYRLARFLLDDTVRNRFDLVILDTPPRLTTGTVNALCASTHFLVPTQLDGLSAETVGTFVDAVKRLKNRGVNPALEFAGVVGTRTAMQPRLAPVEADAKELIKEQLTKVWPQNPYIFSRYIPEKAAFRRAAGEEIAYLKDATVRQLIGELGDEIRSRVR